MIKPEYIRQCADGIQHASHQYLQQRLLLASLWDKNKLHRLQISPVWR